MNVGDHDSTNRRVKWRRHNEMNSIIVGAGLVGTSLAETLRQQGHDITVIDINISRCTYLSEKLDALIINGSGSDAKTLALAGIASADMIIAATPIDEVNLIACMIAKQYGVEHRISRIRSPMFGQRENALLPEHFGLTQVIYPETSTLNAILNIVETPGAVDAQDFQNRDVLLRSYVLSADMPITGRALAMLRADPAAAMLLVVAILREHEVIIPHGDTVLLPGDRPLFIFPRSALDDVLGLMGIDAHARRKAVVFGDTILAMNVARELEQTLASVILIDPDASHAAIAASQLTKGDVLHGSGDDADVLLEANIRFADFFIAATEQSDRNIFSCLLAKSEGAREVIAVVDDDKHLELFQSIGIDHVVNPKQLTAAGILNAIIPGSILSALHISKSDIEVLRLNVAKRSPVTGKALKQSWRKASGMSIVGAVLRGSDMLLPSGETVLQHGDIVLVFTRQAGIKRVRKLFREFGKGGMLGYV